MTDDPVYHSKYHLSGDYRGATLNIESEIHYHSAEPASYVPPLLPPLGEDGRPPFPDPARDLPPHSRLGYDRNPLFTGRERDLTDLALRLLYDPAAVPAVISTGTGGMGKTQLAIEFAYRYGRYFAGGVQWVSLGQTLPDASTEEVARVIAGEVAECGRAMELWTDEGDRAMPPEEKARRTREAWAEPVARLLIFDNCEQRELLELWRPTGGGARVLVTSRAANWPAGYAVHPLLSLPRAESVELLRRYLTMAPRQDANAELDAVAQTLGDLPLALTLAGSTLAAYPSLTVADYLSELDRPDVLRRLLPDEAARPHPYTRHELDVARTFAVSFDRLRPQTDQTGADALLLLASAACLVHGEPFPRVLLLGMLPNDDPRRRDRALARLGDLGLIEQVEGDDTGQYMLRLHRLLALFVVEAVTALDETKGSDWMYRARVAVEQAVIDLADAQNEAGDPRQLRQWDVHLRNLTDSPRDREDKTAALCSNLGYYLRLSGDLVGARLYFERALAIRERVLEPDHPDMATSLNNLGALLDDMGDLAEARSYYERALAIREHVLGPEHPDTATSLNNLGYLLRGQGDLTGALPYYERALSIRERVLGPEHPQTATSLNNLGRLLRAQGDLTRAQPYYERALAIHERILGQEHPQTATSLHNLGGLLRAQGDLTRARSYYERALSIRERLLGPEHPDTGTSLNDLGGLLQAQGDLAGARYYKERALSVYEKALGENHPWTATALNSLGTLLATLDEDQAALEYFHRALAIRERVLGGTHPDTARSLHSLGALLVELGQTVEGRPLLEEALAIRTACLGSEHPDTKHTQRLLSSMDI